MRAAQSNSQPRAATAPPVTPFELNIRRGVGRDIYDLRTQAGLSLREVTGPLAWSSANELSRYERGTTRSLSLERYLELLDFYFGHLPETVRQNHPAGRLSDDPAIKYVLSVVSSGNRMLYEYLAWMHAEVIAERLMKTHLAERLWQYLNKRGTREL